VLQTNGKASAKEVASAIAYITGAVEKKFGVVLTPEPNFVA
jgi:UDP-N-acetylenolpyruvoylglucosamine reductase